MGVAVYVLMQDDGNVCCPAAEVCGVFSTEDLARAHRNVILEKHNAVHPGRFSSLDESDFDIIEWIIDEGVV